MSADNWAKCPKCKKQGQKKVNELSAAASAAYGHVSLEEYAKLVSEAVAFSKSVEKPEDTLREDYEIGIRDGHFEVSYHAGCDKCGFRFDYEREEAAIV